MQEKSLIKKNILQYLEYKGITKYKFYQNTGITRGVLDQNNGMGEENTAKFLAYYTDVSVEWLILGTGNMLKGHCLDEKNPPKALNAQPPEPPAPDIGTMKLILDRYDCLLSENTLLKKEITDLKSSRGSNPRTPYYPIHAPEIGTSIAAEPDDNEHAR